MSNIEWTISIIAQYSKEKNVVNAYKELIKSIVNQDRNEAIRYFIFKYNTDLNQSSLVTIEYNLTPPHTIKESPLADFDLYNSESLNTKLTEYTLSRNSNRHILITWGHAAGFSFFIEGIPIPPKKIKQYKDLLMNLRAYFSNGIIGFDNKIAENTFTKSLDKNAQRILDYLNQVTNGSPFRMLSVDQISNAIQKSFGKANKAIDIMYMMNCCTQTFETGYSLMPKVKYLIGSENFTLFFGIDYQELFKKIHQNPSTDTALLLENIIINYPKKYKKPEILDQLTDEQEDYLKILSLSINKLSVYPDILKVIDQIADHFLKVPNKKELYENIKKAREECKDVNYLSKTLGIIDFTYFCKRLKIITTGDQILLNLLDELISFTQNPSEVIPESHFPGILCTISNGPGNRRRALCPHGFSIFFPRAKENEPYILYFMKYFYHESTTTEKFLPHNGFTKSKWVSFVNDYFEYNIPGYLTR